MNARILRTVLAHAAAAAGGPDAPDGELLARVANGRDEAAFAELVRRHGRLVWAVCRHLSPSESDADDAFQATFLALWQGAGGVRATGTAAPWLHAVAHRVATRAKRTAARRIAREKKAATGEADSRPPPSAWDATMAAVHEEVAGLPESQRVPFVLCVLDGVGVSEAAGRLGWKLGTLSGRLTRAKQALLDRLAKRGIPAAAAGAVLVGPAGVVPAAVLAKGVGLPIATVPSTISSLAQGVTGMAMTRIKLLAAGLLVAGGLTAGLGGGWTTAADPPKPMPGPQERLDEAVKARLKDQEYTAHARVRFALEAANPPGKWEYEFVPVEKVMSADDYTKLFRQKETDGWEFVGSVPVGRFLNTAGGKPPENPLGGRLFGDPTLVFRRPTKAAATADVSTAWQRLLLAQSYDPTSTLFSQAYLSTSLPLLREYLADKLRKNPGAKFGPTLDAALAETPAWKPLVDRYGRTTLEAAVMSALADGYKAEAAGGAKPSGDIVGMLRPVLVETLRKNPGTKFGTALDAVLATNPAYRPAVEKHGRTTLEAEVMTDLVAVLRKEARPAPPASARPLPASAVQDLKPLLIATLKAHPGATFAQTLDAVLSANDPQYRSLVDAYGRAKLEAEVLTELAAGYRADADAARKKATDVLGFLEKTVAPPANAPAAATVVWPAELDLTDFRNLLVSAGRKRFPAGKVDLTLTTDGAGLVIRGPKEQVEWAAGLAKQLTGEK